MAMQNRFLHKGRMDDDSDPSYVENGAYIYALNLRPFSPTHKGAGIGTSVPSTILVSYDFPGVAADAMRRCVGSLLDTVRKRIYWFVWTPTKEFILFYDYASGNIRPVYAYDGNLLGFDPDHLIKSIDIYYDSEAGDILLWSGKGEPRKINTKAGLNRFFNYNASFNVPGTYRQANVSGAFYASLLNIMAKAKQATTEQPLYDYGTNSIVNDTLWEAVGLDECYPLRLFPEYFHQKPTSPRFSPFATYRYDSAALRSVSVVNKSYQFRYKYVYADGQESEWSPISEAVFPVGNTSLVERDGLVSDLIADTPSHIEVRVPVSIATSADGATYASDPYGLVFLVRIAVREVPTPDTPGDWYEFADIPVSRMGDYGLRAGVMKDGFPSSNHMGTFYQNWDISSLFLTDDHVKLVTITVNYDGTQALSHVPVQDAAQLFYNVPKEANSQRVVRNRVFWGGATLGMNISKHHYDSLLDNISLGPSNYSQAFDTGARTLLNEWDATGTSQITTGTLFLYFNLKDPFYEVDFDQPFYYTFTLTATVAMTIGAVSHDIVLSFAATGGPVTLGSADFETFLQGAIAVPSSLPLDSVSISFDENAGELTLECEPATGWTFDTVDSVTVEHADTSFYTDESLLPIRTFKSWNTHHIGFVYQDATGRLSPVITSDKFRFNTGPSINAAAVLPLIWRAFVFGLDSVDVPEDTAVLHVLRKRMVSYSGFFQFAISQGNCLPTSWNQFKPFWIGTLDLSLDEFENTSSGFMTDGNNLYISLNSMTGGLGGSYDVLSSGGRRGSRDDRGNRASARGSSGGARYEPRPDGFGSNRGGAVTPTERPEGYAAPLPERDPAISSFIPSENDLVRFCYRTDETGSMAEAYSAVFPIQQYSEKWNTIVLSFTDIEQKEPALANYLKNYGGGAVYILCELLSPVNNETDLMWEQATQLACKGGKVSVETGYNLQLLGDVYIKPRVQTVHFGPSPSSVNPVRHNFFVEDANFNDFYPSHNDGTGRPNAILSSPVSGISTSRERKMRSIIINSEKSITETDIIRLGNVYDTGIQETDAARGAIEYLGTDGDKLDIYQEDGYAFAYVEKAITTELQGTERILASANAILSDLVYSPYKGGMSDNGNTFAASGYRAYFADSKRGAVYRKSMDGITEISDVGKSGFFKRLFLHVSGSPSPTRVFGFMDDVNDEYVLSATFGKQVEGEVTEIVEEGGVQVSCVVEYPERYDDGHDDCYVASYYRQQSVLVGFVVPGAMASRSVLSVGKNSMSISLSGYAGTVTVGQKTNIVVPYTAVLGYSEKSKGWTSHYLYSAEAASVGINAGHTFVNGQMWLMERSSGAFNTFHGHKRPSELAVSDGGENNVTWLGVGVKSTLPVRASEVSTSLGQESIIHKPDFETLEGIHWASFLRDQLSPGGLYDGDDLKGRWVVVRFVWDGDVVHEKILRVTGAVFNKTESPLSI